MTTIPITVLMPAYNVERYIRDAIDSVLRQSFTDFELLIVNDGSKDETEQIIRSYSDPRIVLFNQSNKGVAAALNAGLKLARGKYIARFDADDICYPDRLHQQYTFMEEHPEYALIGTDVDYMDKNGEYLMHFENIGHTPDEIAASIRTCCPFIHSSVFYRKEAVLDLGGYDEKAHTFEDWLLWTKLVEKSKSLNFRTPLICVRFNPESVTVDEKLRGKRFIELKKEMIFSGKPITDEQERELTGILKAQDFSTFKQYSYDVLMAKKTLWNNHRPRRARQHALNAIRLKPVQPEGYLLLALSFVPERLLRSIYRRSKQRS